MVNMSLGPTLNAVLPPSWTFFLSLNHTFVNIYDATVPPGEGAPHPPANPNPLTHPLSEIVIGSGGGDRDGSEATVYTPLRDHSA